MNGLLHDIGKAMDPGPKQHAIAGYKLLIERNLKSAAQTALTHDFPVADAELSRDEGLIDNSQMIEVQKIISETGYRLIDKVVQIVDVIALPNGFVLMEKRMLSVVLRCGKLTGTLHQIIEASRRNIREIIDLLGYSFYECLPDVTSNSFSL